MTIKRIIQVTKKSWQAEVNASKLPVMVLFWISHPSKSRLFPNLDLAGSRAALRQVQKLVDEFDGKVKFVSTDVSKELELGKKYGITEVPTLVIFRDGKMYELAWGIENFENNCRKLIERNGGD